VKLPNLRALPSGDAAVAGDYFTSKPSTPSVKVELV
jgi:hypothetical protein